MTANSCALRRHVDGHFDGAIAPDDERTMRAHLGSCEPCRARYRRRALFARLDPEGTRPEERIARGLGLAYRPARVRPPEAGVRAIATRFAPEAALVLALAATVLLLLRPAPAGDGFASRGAVDAADAIGSRVQVYRVPRGGGVVRALETVRSDDELAFAYENSDGKPYLMIFAVDDHDRVYWFYPAWTDDAADPPAIPADAAPGVHELGEAVRHRFAGSRIDVHALFLDKPLTVRQIEAEIRRFPHVPAEGIDRIESFTLLPEPKDTP